jgi:hypothetical protein
VPSFALEVVSSDWQKDYREAPAEHESLGTRELVIFDPRFDERREGRRFQRYARRAERLELIDHGNAPQLYSEVLGVWLRAVGEASQLRLRLAEARDSVVLFPPAEEAERQAKEAERQAKEAERQAKEAERQAKEAERQAKEAERQAKEAERQAKEAALARVAELEAELRRRQT